MPIEDFGGHEGRNVTQTSAVKQRDNDAKLAAEPMILDLAADLVRDGNMSSERLLERKMDIVRECDTHLGDVATWFNTVLPQMPRILSEIDVFVKSIVVAGDIDTIELYEWRDDFVKRNHLVVPFVWARLGASFEEHATFEERELLKTQSPGLGQLLGAPFKV